ncbi:MAG: hypothetical protein E7393_00230 [Ruminococcaceae bacterium]|nr:hypothetical protein [Oscillospiraceae bacterium]
MRKLFTTVTIQEEEGAQESFSLDYYLLEKEVCVEDVRVNRFGVEIYKKAKRSDGTPYAEYRKIFDVFHTEAEALEVLSMMARNSVTPISMKDVLEDLLGIVEFVDEGLLMEAV